MNAKAAVPALFALTLAACMTPAADTPSLAGTSWRFTTIDGAPPAAAETRLEFAERLNANAGCNGMSAHWHLDGERLVLEGPLVATRMFCEGKMAQEGAVGALLSGSPSISLSGNTLTLTSAEHSAVLARN